MGQLLASPRVRPREEGGCWWRDELLLDYLLAHCEERLKPQLKKHFSGIKLSVALQTSRHDWYNRFYEVVGEDAASLTALLARRGLPPRRRRRRKRLLREFTTPRRCLAMIPEDHATEVGDYIKTCHCGAPLIVSHLAECPIYKQVFFDAIQPSIPQAHELESHVLLVRLSESRDLTHLVSRFLHLIFKRR